MKLMRVGVAALLCVFATWALADEKGVSPPKADPAMVSAARAEGDAIVAAASAQDVFDNVTGEDGTARIRLRHRQSGFACEFTPGSRFNNVVVYPGALPRGGDVGCNTEVSRMTRTTNFTRDSQSDQQTFDMGVTALKRHHPNAEPLANAPSGVPFSPPAGVPAPLVARFIDHIGAATSIEEVMSAHVRGWLVEQRITAPDTLTLRDHDFLPLNWWLTAAEGLNRGPSAPPAMTQSAAAKPRGPATAQEIATARDVGDAIRRGHPGGAQFDNVTNDRFASLRHRASGVVCGFDLNGAGAVFAGPGSTVTRRTDAVSCLSGVAGFLSTLTFFPNTDHLTAAQALQAASDEYASTTGQLTPFKGQTLSAKVDNAPPHVAAHFTYGPATGPRYVYLGAAVVGDWVVIANAYGPLDNSKIGNLIGEFALVKASMDIAKAGAAKTADHPSS